MSTFKTLPDPVNSISILQWKSSLLSEYKNESPLYLINQEKESTFSAQAELVLMGKNLSPNIIKPLKKLLLEMSTTQASLANLGIISGVYFVRLSLNCQTSDLKEAISNFAVEQCCDFALVNQLPDFSIPGLVLMDMDSTTIQIECIDEIARLHGVGEEVSAVTAAAMRGELDFNGSLRTRVQKLSGAPESILKEVADNMPLMPGLESLLEGLKAANWKVAIASGGFTYFADRLKKDLGFDAAYANTLEIHEQTLTGQVIGDIVNADVKASTLHALAQQYGVPLTQTVAIGDGANDLVMMNAAGMGIAIHAKPIVQEKASVALNKLDLEGALCLLMASLPLRNE